MILPTKHIAIERSLLFVGAEIIKLLKRPRTVSSLWSAFRNLHGESERSNVSYDWFILSLDFLCMLGIAEVKEDKIRRALNDS
jgi:hypothetical protein